MQAKPRKVSVNVIFKTVLIGCFIFISIPAHADYYGGHHYGYGHHGYKHYRHHYGYNHHRSYHGHYGVHARVSDTAGYVILGILGVAVLSHFMNSNRDQDRTRQQYPRNRTRYDHYPSPSPKTVTYTKIAKSPVYQYKEYEGWGWLAKDNSNYAMDIFAIQSQQNLNSGVPKIGFALAAANNGETERAIRSMRKAIRIDAKALNHLPLNKEHESLIKNIANKSTFNSKDKDSAFMLATLNYLQKEYKTANELILDEDQSTSTKNLRNLINEKLL